MHIVNAYRQYAIAIAVYCCLNVFAVFSLKTLLLSLGNLLGDFPVQRFLIDVLDKRFLHLSRRNSSRQSINYRKKCISKIKDKFNLYGATEINTNTQAAVYFREDQDRSFSCEQSVNCLQIMNERHSMLIRRFITKHRDSSTVCKSFTLCP